MKTEINRKMVVEQGWMTFANPVKIRAIMLGLVFGLFAGTIIFFVLLAH